MPAPPPTPGPSLLAEELFEQAFAADEAGRNDEAIALYSDAISAGLQGSPLELAHLEIGLLAVLEAAELDPEADEEEVASRCADARANLAAALVISSSVTAEQLESAIEDACP